MDVLFLDQLGGGIWRAVSFEYNDTGLYMPGQPGIPPIGLWAYENSEG